MGEAVDGELDLEGRHALGTVLQRLTGRRATVRVGRYELGERLGAGGCGAVYAASDPRLDRRVAVKVVLPGRARDDVGREARLLREAQALAKLRHPNVVEVFDVGVDEVGTDARGRPRRGVYIVMELVEGLTLREWLHDTRPDPAGILGVYAQAAAGLAAAHRMGVVHRDFKPANVMLDASGRVKVLDFGLAREDLEPFVDTSPTGRFTPVPAAEGSLTRTGAVMGTPRYMAPEQHAAEPATARSDQYAMAVAVWEALLDAPPFAAPSVQGLHEAKRAGPPPRPHGLDRGLYEVLCRAMQPDPERRFADIESFAARLRRPVRRRRWAAGMLAVIGLGAGVAASASSWGADASMAVCEAPSPVDGWRRDAAAAMAAVQAEEGDDPWGLEPRLQARADRFAEMWTAAHAQLCGTEGAALRPEQRRERLQCLERGAKRIGADLAGLVQRPGSIGARRRLLSLDLPGRCVGDPPGTLFVRTEAEDAELDALADSAMTVLRLERPWDAAAAHELRAGVERAKALGDVWTTTQLLSAHASAMAQQGKAADAVRLALEASWIAEASGDLLLAAEMLPGALSQLYDNAAPREEFERISAHGEELLRATGDPAVPRIGVESLRAMFLGRFGELDAAFRAAETAIARAGDPPRPGSTRYVGVALMTIAHHQSVHGAHDAVWDTAGRILALQPADAPWVRSLAGPAHAYRAAVATERGHDDVAIREALEQIRCVGSVFAPEHPATMVAVAYYGSLLAQHGATLEGLAHLTTARNRLLDEAGSATHQLAQVEHFLLDAEIAHGDPGRAIGYAREVIARDTEELGADSPELVWAWLALAEAHFAAGNDREAGEALDATFARIAPDDVFARTDALYLRAELRLGAGRYAAARDDYLEVVAGLGLHDNSTWASGFRGEALRGVATSLAGLGQRDAARDVARLADEALSHGSYWHRRDREELAGLLEPSSDP